jgi:hypothetical protein
MTAVSAGDPAGRTAKACRARLTPGPGRIHAASSSDHKHASSAGLGAITLSRSAVTPRRYQAVPRPDGRAPLRSRLHAGSLQPRPEAKISPNRNDH